MSVADLKKLYTDLGKGVFVSPPVEIWRTGGVWAPKFPSKPLQEALDAKLGADKTLGDDRLCTGLMIMTKRLDTGSPWPLNNHPDTPFKQDLLLRLTQVVRASTAAPTYFEPQQMDISSRDGRVVKGSFVDGGVSPFNDPALQLLMLAALDGHGFRWETGRDKLLIISVGTGAYKKTFTSDGLAKMPAAGQGLRALQSLMDDCARMNRCTLQWLTDCLTPWTIDRAVKAMEHDSRSGPQLATYARYDVVFEPDWMKKIGIDFTADQLAKIAEMDNPVNMEPLATIGQKAATTKTAQPEPDHFRPEPDHFPDGFNIA
jgi:hypothetical protein